MWTAHLYQTINGRIGPKLNYDSLSWSIELNGTENIQLKLMKSDLPKVDLKVWLSAWWAGVVIFNDGVPIVAGPIITRPSENIDSVSINCGGIRSILANRVVVEEQPNWDWSKLNKSVLTYSGLSLGTIAQRVVAQAQRKPSGKLPINFPIPEENSKPSTINLAQTVTYMSMQNLIMTLGGTSDWTGVVPGDIVKLTNLGSKWAYETTYTVFRVTGNKLELNVPVWKWNESYIGTPDETRWYALRDTQGWYGKYPDPNGEAIYAPDFNAVVLTGNVAVVKGGSNHERTYKGFNVQNLFCDDILHKLSNVIDGPDIMFRPRLVRDNQLVFDMWHGTEDNPRIAQKFTQVWDTTATRSQVSDMTVNYTGTYQATRMFSIGAGSDEALLITVSTNYDPLQLEYPILEKVINRGSSENPDVVKNHGDAELWANDEALLEVQMTVRGDGQNPFGSFWPGDLAQVYTKGWISIPDGMTPMRILSLTGDGTNDVKVSLQQESKFDKTSTEEDI